MQTLKNDFSIVKRKSFQFYSLNLQLSSSETPYHVCLDPNTAHRSTPLQLAEWTYTDVKKHRFEKAAVNSASLSERSSNTDQGPSQGTATHWWAKKKSYKPHHTESTNRSQMLWRSNSAPSHWMHYNEESASQQLQITHYKWTLTGTLQHAERRENLWQNQSIPAIASFALEPTKDPTSTAKSSSMVPYYASHLFVLLTYKSFAPVLQWHN